MPILPNLFLSLFLWVPLRALENGVSLKPPMGWLNWERFGCQTDCDNFPETCLSEELIMRQARALLDEGYVEAGYEYVNIDDCWSEKERDADGRLVADRKRFPHGIRYLADQLHEWGLKIGLYTAIGEHTCAGYPGLEGFMETDARTFAEDYEIDSIKVDGCANERAMYYNTSYPLFGKLLNQTGRPILYNCRWPYDAPDQGEKPDILNSQVKHTCNQWRNYYDVYDSWISIMSIIDQWTRTSSNDTMVRAAGPGHWNDPDMLMIGNPGLSVSEQEVQFCMWAIFAAPLLVSTDLTTIDDASKHILLNQRVIAVNQDPLGRQGYCVDSCTTKHRIYVRELTPSYHVSDHAREIPSDSSDTWAVVLANFQAIFHEHVLTLRPSLFGPSFASRTFYVEDLLTGDEHEGRAFAEFSAPVDESSVVMLRIRFVEEVEAMTENRNASVVV